jgi:hypothetical protein
VLRSGERAALRDDHVVLGPGPEHEIRVVRRIFRMFAVDGRAVQGIAFQLNREKIPASDNARWTGIRVRGLLRNEAYLGTNVIGKVKHQLGDRTPQSHDSWIRAPGSFRPIVSRTLFNAAQRRFRKPKRTVSDEELLDELRGALRRHGRLSQTVINRDPDTHCALFYRQRFGCLSKAYALVGFEMDPQQAAMSRAAFRDRPHRYVRRRPIWSDDEVLQRLRALLAEHGRLSKELINEVPDIPNTASLARRFGGLEGLYRRVNYQPSKRQIEGMHWGRRPRG